MAQITRKAFCAYRVFATGAGHLAVSVTRYYARDVRDAIGEMFDEHDPAKGWALAKKNGYRVVPVTVSAEIGQARDQARKEQV